MHFVFIHSNIDMLRSYHDHAQLAQVFIEVNQIGFYLTTTLTMSIVMSLHGMKLWKLLAVNYHVFFTEKFQSFTAIYKFIE